MANGDLASSHVASDDGALVCIRYSDGSGGNLCSVWLRTYWRATADATFTSSSDDPDHGYWDYTFTGLAPWLFRQQMNVNADGTYHYEFGPVEIDGRTIQNFFAVDGEGPPDASHGIPHPFEDSNGHGFALDDGPNGPIIPVGLVNTIAPSDFVQNGTAVEFHIDDSNESSHYDPPDVTDSEDGYMHDGVFYLTKYEVWPGYEYSDPVTPNTHTVYHDQDGGVSYYWDGTGFIPDSDPSFYHTYHYSVVARFRITLTKLPHHPLCSHA